jgi:molybdenum cofactor guanylyltransferase
MSASSTEPLPESADSKLAGPARVERSHATDRVAVVVLAGGRSERFGADKTRAEVAGVGLLERVLDAVGRMEPSVDEVFVVGPWAPPGVRHLAEPDRFGGPLAAMSFGLGEITAPTVLVLAADHPGLEPSLLAVLVDRLGADRGATAVVPIRAGRREPLVAAYRRSIGHVAREVLAQGQRSMHALLDADDVSVVELVEDDWRVVDPEGRSFADIDTRDDFALFGPDAGSSSLRDAGGSGFGSSKDVDEMHQPR